MVESEVGRYQLIAVQNNMNADAGLYRIDTKTGHVDKHAEEYNANTMINCWIAVDEQCINHHDAINAAKNFGPTK